MTLREAIQQARQSHTAIGHFNVADLVGFKAVVAAARATEKPVIIGVSESEREFWGTRTIAALVCSIREELGIPLFLNADHTHSFEKIQEAVEAGFDAVLFDAGKDQLEENSAETRHVVEYVHSYNYHNGTDILVEAEMGFIGSGSVILTHIPEGAAVKKEDFTKPEEAKRFVDETGIDLLAPAVGNLHGMFAGTANPAISVECIEQIARVVGVPLVLHGGSGTLNSQLQEAVRAGCSIVHISTEIRATWRKALDLALLSNTKEIAPHKIFGEMIRPVERIIEDKIRLFEQPSHGS